MSNSPFVVANDFLFKGYNEFIEITPMKLNKLVYIAHGINLAVTSTPLIDEPVQAWKYGPVIASIYHEFKKFGNSPIREYAPPITNILFTKEQKLVVQEVWNRYKLMTPMYLSFLTHQDGTPWSQYWNPSISGQIIPDEEIKKYYRKFLNIPS